MLLELKKLKPNPTRNFDADPKDQDQIEKLAVSIDEFGFLPGVTARQNPENGDFEIAFGHHRVDAGILKGIKKAEIFVRKISDDEMVRLYATENSTQRGNDTTAYTGSVAAAIKVISKKVLNGNVGTPVSQGSKRSAETILGQIQSDKGIGHGVIEDFLENIPNITERTVRESLSNLKKSGIYAKIIAQVSAEIEIEHEKAEREAEEAERKAEKAKEARAKAKAEKEAEEARAKEKDKKQKSESAKKAETASSKEDPTFDFKGVAKHLKKEKEVQAFRNTVTDEGIAEYIPFEKQEAIAKEIAKQGASSPHDLSRFFIRQSIIDIVLEAKVTKRKLDAEDQERLRAESLDYNARFWQEEFVKHSWSVAGNAKKIKEVLNKWPDEKPFPIIKEFTVMLPMIIKALTELETFVSTGKKTPAMKALTK